MAIAPTWLLIPQGPPPDPPAAAHVKVLAILDVVYGSFAVFGALALLLVFGLDAGATTARGPGWVAALIGTFGALFILYFAVVATLALTASILLLRRRRAAKGWGIAAAVVQLLNFPLGTALGVYGLVILSRAETARLLEATP